MNGRQITDLLLLATLNDRCTSLVDSRPILNSFSIQNISRVNFLKIALNYWAQCPTFWRLWKLCSLSCPGPNFLTAFLVQKLSAKKCFWRSTSNELTPAVCSTIEKFYFTDSEIHSCHWAVLCRWQKHLENIEVGILPTKPCYSLWGWNLCKIPRKRESAKKINKLFRLTLSFGGIWGAPKRVSGYVISFSVNLAV